MTTVLISSILSALATGIGALPILLVPKINHRWRDILMAFAAGIMVAASMSNLIPAALEEASYWTVVVGILLGTLVLGLLERTIPHIDLGHTKQNISFDAKSMLIIAAITLHNLPEGLSVGVSFGSGSDSMGVLIALAIGLQNAPEGLLVALFLINQNVGRFKSFLIATMTGAVEIVTSILGFYLTSLVSGLVPYGLSFAAGAMLFIVYKELIPESHGDGHEVTSTYAFIIGLLVMIGLIVVFG